jgi:hypothetical protein
MLHNEIFVQPLPPHQNTCVEFVDETTGTNVPKQFIPGVEKGFMQMCEKGMNLVLICTFVELKTFLVFHFIMCTLTLYR